jgi:hypothetical protein
MRAAELERGALLARSRRRQQCADLAQREAELLAFEDQHNAIAVGARIDARRAFALGRDQAEVLVEAQRARGETERPRQLANGKGRRGLVAALGSVGRGAVSR